MKLTEEEHDLLKAIAMSRDGAGIVPSKAATFNRFLSNGLIESVKLYPTLVGVTRLGREALGKKPMSRIAELVHKSPVDVIIAAFTAGAERGEVLGSEGADDAALRWASELE